MAKLGHWGHIHSFESYLPEFEQTACANQGWIELLSLKAIGILAGFGVLLFIGCLPWAVFVGLGEDFVSLYSIRRHGSAVRLG